MQSSVIGQWVVVEEHARGDVKGNENVDGIVLVRGQDEEYTKGVEDPWGNVKIIHSSGSICKTINT